MMLLRLPDSPSFHSCHIELYFKTIAIIHFPDFSLPFLSLLFANLLNAPRQLPE